MQRAFLDLSGVRTNVLTYGRWVEQSPNTKEIEDIILLIPGNPGVTGFYKMFMLTLHEKTGFPVWIVGHAGHEVPPNNTVYPIPTLKGNENLFGLEAQIEHKKDFIQKYVPESVRLHLIGHSLGAYIILELLKDESIKSRVADVQLLFPTLEYMAETPNGKFMTSYIKPIVWLIVFLSWIFTNLPSVLQNVLVYLYMKVVCMPKMHFRTVVHFVEPTILEKIFFLAFDELDHIKARNNTTIKENSNKIKFLFGKTDGWAPPSYCDNLKGDIPEANAELTDFDHAFVLKQSRQVGSLVGGWIAAK